MINSDVSKYGYALTLSAVLTKIHPDTVVQAASAIGVNAKSTPYNIP